MTLLHFLSHSTHSLFRVRIDGTRPLLIAVDLTVMKVVGVSMCDPVQQKVHLVGQVHSEIMNKIVCKI